VENYTMSGQSQRFLTPDDLYQLTGYRRPSLQCRALKESGVFFVPRKDGRPGTTWDHVTNPAGLKLVVNNPEEEEPNFKDM
jgi:hypothetical protein